MSAAACLARPDPAPGEGAAVGRGCVAAMVAGGCGADGGISGSTAGTRLAAAPAGPGLPQPVGF